MLIPSIDIMTGAAVQLVQGRDKKLDAGDPRPLAHRFSLVGETAIIDLDAALGRGSNSELIRQLLRIVPARVGGGIRDVDTAIDWLDAGARKVILGTAATPDILSKLPRERTIAALDARDGEVVVEGWTRATGANVIDRIRELRDCVGGFLVTFVEREGGLGGSDLDMAARFKEEVGDCELTIAGGVTTPEEVAQLHRLGIDAQVGMALYTGKFDEADCFAAMMQSDRPDGLVPTVVADEHGVALGLAYSDAESLREAIRSRRGVYRSRSRGLWVKGESSGATQTLLKVDLDCDSDALRFTVHQEGAGFCHKQTRTCWGEGAGIPSLARRIADRATSAPPGSYTARLFTEPGLLNAKIAEEARELTEARSQPDITHEAADVIYFTLAKLIASGLTLEDVERKLDQRALKVTRRPGDAKPTPTPTLPPNAPSLPPTTLPNEDAR